MGDVVYDDGMTDDVDVKLVVVYPARWAHRVAPVEGSTLMTANCGHRAFIAPSGAAFLAGDGHDAYTVCMACAEMDDLLESPQVSRQFMPGSRGELNDAIGVGEADQVFAHFMHRYGFKH